jgi:hypothetical protein
MERVIVVHRWGMHPLWRLSVFVALAFLLVSCGRVPTATESAQQFFNLVSSGKTQEAHDSASFAFQTEQNARLFGQTARERGLIGAKSVTIEPVSEESREAKLKANVTTAEGQQLTYNVTMQKDGKAWRVFTITVPKGGSRTEKAFSAVGKGAAFEDALARSVPDEKTLRELIGRTLTSFNDAVRQKSFAEFYKNVSISWQTQLTERQLQRAFQPFIDQGVDISGALQLTPEMDVAPQITTEGLLTIAGHYPSKPYHVEFTVKYIYEAPEWKLFGIDVNLRKPEEGDAAAPPTEVPTTPTPAPAPGS